MSKILDRPIPAYKGADRTIKCTWKRNGSPMDITGITFRADVKDAVGGNTLFTLTSDNGGFTVTDATTGEYQINISESDLNTVTVPTDTNMTFPFTNLVMDIEADDSGTPIKVFYALLQIYETVTS